MKIAVYTITKNEEQFMATWAQSCKDADYRLVVDTGSTDETLKVANENGCNTASIKVDPWRFDTARNMALDLLPDDIDMCISLDADEILTPGWRNAFEGLDPLITRPRYKYVWSWVSEGVEGLTYSGDKIHARHGYKWTHPVHEVLTPINGEVQGWIGLEIHHHPDPTKSRSQYLPLLELAVEELPDDDRNRFYLGRELMFHGRNDEAIVHFQRHLELSAWPPERATSMRYLGRITENKEHWFLRACAESPYRRETWVELARFYYEIRKWDQCYAAAIRALEITEKPLEYLCEAESWGALPHDLAAIAAWNTGRKDLAVKHASKAFTLEPTDIRLRENLALIYKSYRKSKVFAIIPTKSNLEGLNSSIKALLEDESVSCVAVIAETDKAHAHVTATFWEHIGTRVTVTRTEEGLGIQHMWNTGMKMLPDGEHCLFVNDDTVIKSNTASILAGYLDTHSDAGLICPQYDSRIPNEVLIDTVETCRSRYDGSGGFAGFCMMLASDLAQQWSFDERMIWWYGDDDVIHWTLSKNRRVGICTVAFAEGNTSWTTVYDPPKDFSKIVENDRLVFEEIWNK